MEQFNTPVDGALFLFDGGLKVFPIQAGSKMPPKGLHWKDWSVQASRQSIETYAAENPNCNWAVDCGASNLMVLDIDVKEDVNGFDSLKDLPTIEDTFEVTTPSKGKHLYYVGKSKTSVGEVGKGLDTRSNGGYVISPGSRDAKGIPYLISSNRPLANMPTWIHTKLQEKKQKSEMHLNTDDFLESFEEGNRNKNFTKLAGHLRAIGLDKDLMLLAMMEVNSRISNPLPEKELEIISWSMSKKAPGNALATAKAISDFAQVVPGEVIQFHNFQDVNIKAIPPVKWILKNQFISGLVSILVSPGGLGKSLLSLLQAVSVSTGIELSGDKVSTQGRVWIHNAEDGKHDLERRLAAISIHHNVDQKLFNNITYTTGLSYKINLASSDRKGVVKNEPEIERIKQMIKDNGIVLWLIDPFIRMHRVDENSNEEMDVIMEILTDIAQHTKCAIGIVHHTNKSGGQNGGDANASRGASAVVNATRIATTLGKMKAEEASNLREEGEFKTIPPENAFWYIRADNAKANFQSPRDQVRWYKKIPVQLPNGEEVGCLQLVKLYNADEINKEKSKVVMEDAFRQSIDTLMSKIKKMTLNKLATSMIGNEQISNLLNQQNRKTLKTKIQKYIEEKGNKAVDGHILKLSNCPMTNHLTVTREAKEEEESFLE